MSLARYGARIFSRATTPFRRVLVNEKTSCRLFSSLGDKLDVHISATHSEKMQEDTPTKQASEKVVVESCGDLDDESDDEMEQEEMFVDPHESFEHQSVREWGGPRRGGRLPEPTRFGDWERKGRCTDF